MLTAQQHWLIDLGIMRSPCAIDEPVIKPVSAGQRLPRMNKADKRRIKGLIIDLINSQGMKRITASALYDQLFAAGELVSHSNNEISFIAFRRIYTDVMRSGLAITPTKTAKKMIDQGKTVLEITKETGLSRQWITELIMKRKQS